MENKYLTVAALTKYIKRKIDVDPHLKDVLLKGEISNFSHHSRGHMYMTIKDDQAKIQAVMFAGNNRYLKFKPENGMNVLIRGEISVYEAFGQYQLYIQQMEPDGLGALYLAFEQLKEKLHKQGYFAEEHKKEIPLFPNHIGVITSPTGAAVRDIITTIKRRYPIVQITVIPVLVQGENAASSIAAAIDLANDINSFDTLIVGRGGGSIEELWAFNEEIVAESIFRSKIPIISAVGHETDITISDYVADLRAPTPTGAAELAVQSQIELREKIDTLTRSLTRELTNELRNNQRHLDRLKAAYAFRYPGQLIKQKEQALDSFVASLQKGMVSTKKEKELRLLNLYKRFVTQHPQRQLEQSKSKLDEKIKSQNYYMTKLLENKTIQLTNTIDKLSLVNPLEIMKRGFALPYTPEHKIIKSVNQVKVNDYIKLKISDGNLHCQVLEVEEEVNLENG
ncbi:exodeoxyribonuclease VII large subunit [Oceanobacillus chungangensis]|uniref:Exodeoxyribonuclease 7 large subunit n=1 Tax=Oceanobacillus chungangensis TaxID=1229152 RepID=A0A3D8Q280_9BACI|nr:exodeoxyribonuclease VII large subunit [Oceanobacillus chungangensis]RDW21967.1 exodeoxyribonuclease VII large subunit [Oceanobacillus chungangensis]